MTTPSQLPPAWTRVSTLDAFQGLRQLVCRFGEWDLLLLRVGDEVIALHDHCTHLGKPLAGGRVMGSQITCPFHGACFDLKTGVPVSGPAVFPLFRFPVRLEGEEILVDLSRRPPNRAASFEMRTR